MSKSDESDLNRRRFLQTSAAAAVGGVCFSSATIKRALAEARKSEKPLFTETNFNALLPQKHDDTLRQMMQEAKQDLRAFIRGRFYLTKEQEKELDSLSAEVISRIQASIDDMLRLKATARVRITRREDKPKQNHLSQDKYINDVQYFSDSQSPTPTPKPSPAPICTYTYVIDKYGSVVSIVKTCT